MVTSEFKDISNIENLEELKSERASVASEMEAISDRFMMCNLYDIAQLVRLGNYKKELDKQIEKLETR